LMSVVLPEPFGPIQSVEALALRDFVLTSESAVSPEVLGDAVDPQQRIVHGSELPRGTFAPQSSRPRPTIRRCAVAHDTTSSTPTTSSVRDSEENGHLTTCCTVPSSSAPMTGPIQCEVLPYDGHRQGRHRVGRG